MTVDHMYNTGLTNIALQNVEKVLLYFSSDGLPLIIRWAFFLSGAQNSRRIGDRHTGNITTIIAGGRSETAHGKDQNQQAVRSHDALT